MVRLIGVLSPNYRTSARSDDADLRDGALFVVGDPRQSIYAFRAADIDRYIRRSKRLAAQMFLFTSRRWSAQAALVSLRGRPLNTRKRQIGARLRQKI
jgi:ATP-dependent exoDNAse (exonuclease V) beta subunit